MLLKAALNGDRSLKEHSCIPISFEQLTNDINSLIPLGVQFFHIHPRAKNGTESLQYSVIEPVLSEIRKRSPEIMIGISTGAWIMPNLSDRIKQISKWGKMIDFASVNFHEEGAIEIADILMNLGIGVEAGLYNCKATELLAKSGLAEQCIRLMFEPVDVTFDEAMKTVNKIEKTLDLYKIQNSSRLLHGLNTTAWQILLEAKRRGYDSRIGFEDTLLLPNGEIAKSNVELMNTAIRLLNEI